MFFPGPFPAGIERGGDSFELSFLRRGNGERRSAKQLWDLLAAKAPESRTAGLVQGCRAFEQAGQPAHYAALYPRLPLSQVPQNHPRLLMAQAPRPPGQRVAKRNARKEKQLKCVLAPRCHRTSGTGRQLQTRRRPKRARRQGKIGACTDTPTSSRAEGHCTGARLAPFSLPPGAAHSLFGQDQKENGGRIPRGNGPRGEVPPSHPLHFPIIFQIKEGTQSWIRF